LIFSRSGYGIAAASLVFSATIALADVKATVVRDDKAAFTVLSVEDGLVNSSVSGIVQDSKGFLWFATQGGLCRYDGSEFKIFENEPFNEGSLVANLIQTIYLDEDDVLWIGTYNGLNRFDIKTERFTLYTYDADRADSLSNDLVIAIARDARGALWVGTINGLNRLDESKGTFIRYLHDTANPRSIPNNTIRSLFRDSRGRLWIGASGGGFARYDFEDDAFDNLTGTAKGPPASLSLQSIGEDSLGYLWLGAWGLGLVRFAPDTGEAETFIIPDGRIYVVNTQDPGEVRAGTWGGGLYVLDKASGTVSSYSHSKALGVLPHDVVYSILEDASGELWIGTNGGGVARMDRTRRSFTAYVSDASDPKAIPHGKTIAALVDSRGDLWISVYSGGIHRLDRKTGGWIHFRNDPEDPSSLPNDTCNALYEDSGGGFWVGSNAGLALMDREKGTFTVINSEEGNTEGLSSDIIYSILEERGVGLWIGTYTTGLDFWNRTTGEWKHFAYDPKNPLSISDNLIYSIQRDENGKLWIATNNGLNRMEDESFVRYHYDPKRPDGISSNAIMRIAFDSKGILWVATRGGGLSRYHPDTDTFSHITRADGLPNNMVMAVLEDRRTDLWVVTQTGIALYDRETSKVKPISFFKALDNASFNSGSTVGKKGELYFGSVGIVTEFDPYRYEPNDHVPPVYITAVTAANRPKLSTPLASGGAGASPLRLSYYENSVEFRFAAIDFRDPAANQFAYRLEGFDKDWNYSGSVNHASYTNLPGGSYVFRVKAANNDGLWNEAGASVDFRIAVPPYWSLPAWALYLLMIASAGYAIATLRSNRLLTGKVAELTNAETALLAAGEESRTLALAAEKANRAKSSFIATVSHEIRTPLNGVIGMTEMLERSTLDERQKEQVSMIRSSGQTLLQIINDVLDISKIEADKIEIESIAFPLDATLDRLRDAFGFQAEAKGIFFSVAKDPSLPKYLRGDPLRIFQVLSNLTGNAVKFTDKGGVRVFARMGAAPATGAPAIVFMVEDTGIGIRGESLPSIFDPFNQEDQSTTRRFGGSGLGLSISKRLVDLMGGSIRVESVQGKGSVFSFELPLTAVPESELAVPAVSGEDAAVPEYRPSVSVLVVDDDPVNRFVARSFLREIKATVEEADSGHAAIALLSKLSFDLVLLDCSMPGMDGYETAVRIRSPGNGSLDPSIPIIAMTAHVLEEDRARCIAVGMDEVIVKPLTLKELVGTIDRVMSSRTRNRFPVFASEAFISRYEGAAEAARELLKLFLAQSSPLAGEALKAGERADWAAAAAIVHRLKGSAGAIGGDRLAAAAERCLEELRRPESPAEARLRQLAVIAAELAELETELKAALDGLGR